MAASVRFALRISERQQGEMGENRAVTKWILMFLFVSFGGFS